MWKHPGGPAAVSLPALRLSGANHCSAGGGRAAEGSVLKLLWPLLSKSDAELVEREEGTPPP